eukprot:14623000-Heterocapsa_arctica.AAC.1
MEITAAIWALAWVVAAQLECPVILEADSLFALNLIQARWDAGAYTALADLGIALLALSRQQTVVQCRH